jgi:hypothetical protein
VAGNGQCCYYDFDDAVPATSVQLDGLTYLAVDGAGNLFILQLNVVRRVSPDGIIRTIARLPSGPLSAVADSAGNLFVSSDTLVFKLSPDGRITIVAGNGTRGDSGDGGRATDAQLRARSVAVDSAGNLFIADYVARKVRRVSPDGIIATVAGDGTDGFSGDGGPATSAQLTPFYVAVDPEATCTYPTYRRTESARYHPEALSTPSREMARHASRTTPSTVMVARPPTRIASTVL